MPRRQPGDGEEDHLLREPLDHLRAEGFEVERLKRLEGSGSWSVRRPGGAETVAVGRAAERAARYPASVSRLSIQGLRERLPLIVFILLLILLVMVVGVACACATDHPMQTVERALSAIPAAPAVVVVWSYTFVAMLVVAFVVPQRRRALGRASPQELQRFLF